jgi:hypothetical protein
MALCFALKTEPLTDRSQTDPAGITWLFLGHLQATGNILLLQKRKVQKSFLVSGEFRVSQSIVNSHWMTPLGKTLFGDIGKCRQGASNLNLGLLLLTWTSWYKKVSNKTAFCLLFLRHRAAAARVPPFLSLAELVGRLRVIRSEWKGEGGINNKRGAAWQNKIPAPGVIPLSSGSRAQLAGWSPGNLPGFLVPPFSLL